MSIRKNAAALYGVQIANYILPFITLPYLSHRLGPAAFGGLGFAQTVAQILLIFTDFGFDLTSTRRIAIAKNDKSVITLIFWTTIFAKFIFASISSILMIGMAETVFRGGEEHTLLYLATLLIWGSVITPTWLYQGLQKMPFVAVCSIAARIMMLPLIFLWVRSPADLSVAGLLQFSPPILAGLMLAAVTVRLRLVGAPIRLTSAHILAEIRESSHIFLSSALTSVYMYANVLVLRTFGGSSVVGYYVAAEKITTPLRQFFMPPIQAYFPKICSLFSEGKIDEAGAIIRKLIAVFTILAVIAFAAVSLFGSWFVSLFFGAAFLSTFGVLRILVVVPMMIGVAAVLVQLCIIASGNQAVLKKIYAVGAIFHLCQAPLSVYYFGAPGAAISVLLTEAVMTACLAISVHRIFKKMRVATVQRGA